MQCTPRNWGTAPAANRRCQRRLGLMTTPADNCVWWIASSFGDGSLGCSAERRNCWFTAPAASQWGKDTAFLCRDCSSEGKRLEPTARSWRRHSSSLRLLFSHPEPRAFRHGSGRRALVVHCVRGTPHQRSVMRVRSSTSFTK